MKHILIIFSLFLFSFTIISCTKKDDSTSGDCTATENTNNLHILNSFEMLNLSCIADQYFIDMARDAESKMSSLNAKTLLIIYPLGERVSLSIPSGSEDNTYFRSETHKVVLTEPEINKINKNVSNFLDKATCLESERKTWNINSIDWWLRNGGSSQVHVAICVDIRIIMISIDPNSVKIVNREELSHTFTMKPTTPFSKT